MRRPLSLSSPSSGWTSGGIPDRTRPVRPRRAPRRGEAVQGAIRAQRLQELEGGGAAGHLQGDAAKPHLFVLPAAHLAHPYELHEERQGIVQLSHRPADVVQALNPDLLVHTTRQPPATLGWEKGPHHDSGCPACGHYRAPPRNLP